MNTPAAPPVTGTRMLLDTATIYFRSFFGLPRTLKAPDGTPINAVRGLLDAMATLIEQYRPAELACAWDNDWRPNWRVELVEGYKTHRVSKPRPGAAIGAGGRGAVSGDAEDTPEELGIQVPIIREVLDAMGIPVIGVDDHEADDVLGTLAASSTLPCLVVSGDRDLFQLAHHHTRVIYIGKGVRQHEVVDDEWLLTKYGVRAQQYVDFSVLRGDPSDGLPGIKGIGEKSAAALLAQHKDLQGLCRAAQDPDSGLYGAVRARISDSVDYLVRAQQVVQVVTDLPVDDSGLSVAEFAPDAERLAELAERWGLGGSLTRLQDALRY